MGTPRFYAAQVKANFLAFASDFARFLVNDLATFTGPGWTIVEAYDDATTSRQVPATATDMDSFVGTFSWKDNTVGVNDWIVIQSNIGGGVNECQVFFKITSSSAMQIQLVPLGNWTTGGAATATPTVPATAQPATAVTINGFTTRASYSITSDEGMFAFLFDRLSDYATDVEWIYVGELEGHRPADAYPYIIWSQPSEVSYQQVFAFTGRWRRLSPLDVDAANDTGTSLTNGQDAHYYSFVLSGQYLNRSFPGVLTLGETRPHPVGVFFQDAGHRHWAGYLRHVYSAHNYLGVVGTFGGQKYLFRNDGHGASNNDAGICFRWDETTTYPPDQTV